MYTIPCGLGIRLEAKDVQFQIIVHRGRGPNEQASASRIKQLSEMSRHVDCRVQMLAGSHHAVKHGEQLLHKRGERHFLQLTSCQQPPVELPKDRVTATVHQRSCVEHSADSGATTYPGLKGATPTRAAICFLSRVPSSNRYTSNVRNTCCPVPGTLRSRSSFPRQAGLLRIFLKQLDVQFVQLLLKLDDMTDVTGKSCYSYVS